MHSSAELRHSFNHVADALESYFEGMHGQECGMSIGGFVRAYRDLLTHEDDSVGRMERLKAQESRAEKLMLQFIMFYLDQRGNRAKIVEPSSSTFPPPFDTNPEG